MVELSLPYYNSVKCFKLQENEMCYIGIVGTSIVQDFHLHASPCIILGQYVSKLECKDVFGDSKAFFAAN